MIYTLDHLKNGVILIENKIKNDLKEIILWKRRFAVNVGENFRYAMIILKKEKLARMDLEVYAENVEKEGF